MNESAAEETEDTQEWSRNLNDEQLLRCYIFEHYASAEYEGHVVIANMQAILDWIMEGKIAKSAPPKGSKPKIVPGP